MQGRWRRVKETEEVGRLVGKQREGESGDGRGKCAYDQYKPVLFLWLVQQPGVDFK